MLRDGMAIGTIVLHTWATPRPFSDSQIALLQTFADQAVIAIENVRLFTETREALERQTATSEILRVIGSSQTDVQPVFDAIAAKALDLCRATTGWVYTFDGELIHVGAAHGLSPEGIEARRQSYPMPPSRGGATSRAVLSRAVVYMPNIREDHEYTLQALAEAATVLERPCSADVARRQPDRGGYGHGGRGWSILAEADRAARDLRRPGGDRDRERPPVQELETRNRDLTETLEQQTATSEILRVISSSPTDVQPVFDTIAQSAARLCEATFSAVFCAGMAAHARGRGWRRPGRDRRAARGVSAPDRARHDVGARGPRSLGRPPRRTPGSIPNTPDPLRDDGASPCDRF